MTPRRGWEGEQSRVVLKWRGREEMNWIERMDGEIMHKNYTVPASQ